MNVLINSINTSNICGILHDVARGTGVITRELRRACENVTSTLDLDLREDKTVGPKNDSDFLNPATYQDVRRPDWIVARSARLICLYVSLS
jgi:hypothetical protein